MATEVIFDKFLEYNEFIFLSDAGIVLSKSIVAVLAAYLLFVLKIGPSYMKSRAAYDLKSFIVVYNVFQVIACAYLIYMIVAIDLPTLHFWQCIKPAPGSVEEANFDWICTFTYYLKAAELSETVVFVLRKKQRQVSFLHVFHHCSSLFLTHQIDKIYRESSAFYPILLNSGVHVFMYSYYLVAAIVSSNVVVKLTPIKKAITTIQMIQFGLILLQVAIGLMCGCKVPPVILTIYVIIICAFFYMFYDFYKNNYNNKHLKKMQS